MLGLSPSPLQGKGTFSQFFSWVKQDNFCSRVQFLLPDSISNLMEGKCFKNAILPLVAMVL